MVAAVAVAGVAALRGGGESRTASGPPDLSDAIDAAARGTVLVSTRLGGEETGTGSGFVLDPRRGLVVTAAHVLNFQPTAGRAGVHVHVGRDRRRARVVGLSPCDDLALLRVADRSGLHALEMGDQAELRRGDSVVVAGYPEAAPGARNVVARQATVVQPRGRAAGPFGPLAVVLPGAVHIEGGSSIGASGGPVVTADGRVVGVVALRGSEGGDTRTFAIGADRVRSVTRSFAAGSSPGWLGRTFGLIGRPARGVRWSLIVTASLPGVRRGRDLPGGPFLIDAVDGRRVAGTAAGYCRAVAARSGERVGMTVRRARMSPDGTYAPVAGAPRLRVRADLDNHAP